MAPEDKGDEFGSAWDRDPNRMNTHLQVRQSSLSNGNITVNLLMQVMWDDLIGEPEGVRSIDCAWNCSKSCFQAILSSSSYFK